MADKDVGGQRDIGIVEKNFFFVDINNLDTVETRLYGYCIANDLEMKRELSFDDVEFSRAYSNGTYVLIQNIDDKIYISQDYSGSCGIYLFRQGDYFALSNSFLLLVGKLAAKFPLTFNFDYANAYIVSGLCSLAYSETLVNEIEVLPRNVQVVISKIEKSVELVDIDYQEHSVEIDSVEGLQLLDRWYTKWLCIIRKLAANSDNIMCDLSGGFDSRMVFGPFLHAGIDLDKVRFNSGEGAKADYKVASQIADHFSVALNAGEFAGEMAKLELEECINKQVYVKFGFHKEIYWGTRYWQKPVFWFRGYGGECIRAYHFNQPRIYLENECKRGVRYKNIDVSNAVRKIISHAYEKITAKFTVTDADSSELTQLMYRETRCRNHFGKQAMVGYCANEMYMSPLMDVDLGKIYNRKGDNADLLMAVIFTRYYPELLEFPFEGGRDLGQDVLGYAKRVNEILPLKKMTSKDTAVSQKRLIYLGDNKVSCSQKDSISSSDAEELVYDAFKSDKVHKMIALFFHEDIYGFADGYIKNQEIQSLREIVPIMSAYIVLDLIASCGRKLYKSAFEQMQAAIAYGPINSTMRVRGRERADTYASPIYAFLSPTDIFLFPFEKIPQNTSIILYGAGKVGQAYCMQIKKSGYCKMTAWVDRDSKIFGVESPDVIVDHGLFDYIVIAIESEKVMREIKEYLLSMGVEEQKIVWRDPRIFR